MMVVRAVFVIARALCVVVVLRMKWFGFESCSMRKHCGSYELLKASELDAPA
jgi:hypothetical protein